MPYTDGAKTLKIRVVAIGEKETVIMNENVNKQDDIIKKLEQGEFINI